MKIKTYLTSYRPKAERFLDRFFTEERKKAGSVSPLCAESLQMYREYMRGGKMIRGGLVCLGYESAGGQDKKAIIAPSVAVEIIHSFILIHDDWIDNDLTRRGKPTIHRRYKQAYQERLLKRDKDRWAGGMAFILGDVGCWLGYQLLNGASFPAELKIKAISLLSQNLIKTGYGQFLDITYDLEPGFDWDEIIRIRKLKSAYYTLVMPLAVGISLAGGSKQQLKAAQDFGFPVGIAFQLRDDYLGVFGNEKTTGKSASGDLREGKKTLLIAKALANLQGAEKRKLRQFLGKKDLSAHGLQQAQRLLKKSRAGEENQQLAQELVDQGKKAIRQLTTNPQLTEAYTSLADYLIQREK